MMKPLDPVSPPSRWELLTLRLMILLGVCSMSYLLYCLFLRAQIGYAPFYWVLMFAITFNCLRILHEWYHYFSIAVPKAPPAQHAFTVDILTTFCPGEPYEMIVNTLTAIQQIRYPHTTYLCDEANDPYLIDVCQRLGVRHVTRNNRKDAKAGNINNALQYATGELCVVLDPDHVPAPDFLDPIVAYFNDPKVGFVQIVQAYSNLGDGLIAKGAAQQTFQFYGPIMMTMNSYGTVLAIGANCTFRRAALDSIGGHAAGLSEDMHTAMQLHAKGWTSVYVPAVLARGLVPATMSAYYSQQLKWARGTFELLVTTYPKLFRQFTWRQRLHYGTIPFHYFSGVIFLINFLIPILSLSLGLIPFRVDLVNFALLGLPMLTATILIRHFVQRWVMEEEERGFHVVGGLLLIGTWWIYILGLVYTIIRKKVPYIPTPKDDNTPDSWTLGLPNIVMAAATIGAIVYGLWYDWNPFTWVMAGIAGINCLILLFNIIVSYRKTIRRMQEQSGFIRALLKYPLIFKKQFWVFRHLHIYAGIRKLGLPLLLMMVFITWYFLGTNAEMPTVFTHKHVKGEQQFYTGIYSPGTTDGIPSMEEIKSYQQQHHTHFNIISLYIPWGDEPRCQVPDSLVKAIYRNGSLPMITWEPWAALFKNTAGNKALQQEQKIFAHISAGFFDHYLQQFSDQVKALRRPVYIRFAHEADNPAYPWSATGHNTPEEFKAAWKYVYNYFLRNGASNVIWVWNPWSAEAVASYFPGKSYVDWIGITSLNYGPQRADSQWRAFSTLYAPFRKLPELRAGIPVMIAEMGSLAMAGRQEQWLKDALRDINSYNEIHAFVLFNSNQDQNILRPVANNMLDWKVQSPQALFDAQKQYVRIGQSSSTTPPDSPAPLIMAARHTPALPLSLPGDTLRGLNYHKGENWYRNLHSLTRLEVTDDFKGMKKLGINTIRRFGPGVYDRNILAVANELNMHINYGFWVPEIKDMQEDKKMLDKLESTILHRVSSLKHQRQITAWNIGNTNWQQLGNKYFKPVLYYQQSAYLNWLEQLLSKMKAIDSTRPITVEVYLTDNIAPTLQWLHTTLPQADAFGIITGKDSTGLSQLDNIQVPYYISQIPVEHYITQLPPELPVFITTWQDLETRDFVTFDGLADQWGRFKPAYFQLGSYWHTLPPQPDLPEIRILRPAKPTFAHSQLTYHALIYQQQGWQLADSISHQLKFEWHLIKTDNYGNDMFLKSIGTGPSITIDIPEHANQYRLYLQAVNGNQVRGTQTPLNTPLFHAITKEQDDTTHLK